MTKKNDHNSYYATARAFADSLEEEGKLEDARAFRIAVDRMEAKQRHPLFRRVEDELQRYPTALDGTYATQGVSVEIEARFIEAVRLCTQFTVDELEPADMHTLGSVSGFNAAEIERARLFVVRVAKTLPLRASVHQ